MRREPAGKTRGVDVHHSGEARIDDQQRLLRVRLVGHIEGGIKLQAITVKMGLLLNHGSFLLCRPLGQKSYHSKHR
jgi:hypothetical protein